MRELKNIITTAVLTILIFTPVVLCVISYCMKWQNLIRLGLTIVALGIVLYVAVEVYNMVEEWE